MSKAGDWQITVTEPHPVWVELTYLGGAVPRRFRATELRDLEYAVQRAIIEARAKLPDRDKHEMD